MQKAQYPSHGSRDKFLHLPKLGLQREYRGGGGGWGGDACISGSSPQGENEHQITPPVSQDSTQGDRCQSKRLLGLCFGFTHRLHCGNNQETLGA